MEPPQKRPRLDLAPHEESDDDDELNYEPEEISQKRDPGARLARSRATAAFGLKSAFESIFERYERDFEGVADEIDLRTADIVVDNRHLEGMRNERDMGNMAKEEEEIPLRDSGAEGREVERTGSRSASRGDEDEDQILQGRSSALVRKGPGALVSRMPSVLGQRPAIPSRLGGPPQLPPFGASPLFFGSWGLPVAMDPAWQAPQLQVPPFKSSFAADLFTGRYQLPAREASKSIWGPGSHSDDEEDTPVEKPRIRLAPPTRRVPARPKAMKFICTPSRNSDGSGDEDCILMGVGASQISNENPNPSSRQRESNMHDDEADLLLDRLEQELESRNETECGDGTTTPASSRPITRAEEPPQITTPGKPTNQTAGNPSNSILSSSSKGKKRYPANKRTKARRISTPRKAQALEDESPTDVGIRPAGSSLQASHSAHSAITKRQGSVVIELQSSCLLDDGTYLDFSNMAGLPTEESLSAPVLDDQAYPSPEGQHDQITEEPKDDQIPSSNRTIPDSQEPPISLPMSSASNAPVEQTPEKSRQDEQTEKKKISSVYDFSDEEVGFLARPPRKRKRISDITSSPTASERRPGQATASTNAEAHASRNRLSRSGLPSASKLVTARDSSESLFSPLNTRSARAKARPSGTSPPGHPPSDEAGNLPRKRRLTPTSLNSANDTESEPVPAQGPVDPPLPIALVSPPPESEAAGTAATAEEQSNVQADDPEPVAGAVVIPDDDTLLQRSTRSSGGRITRGRAKEAEGNTDLSSGVPAPPHPRPGPSALSPPDRDLPGESQDTLDLTSHREPLAKLPAISPSDPRPQPATPSRTPKLKRSFPDTPTSVPSTGHRSLTSLIPERPDSDSEDELTSSSLWSLFQKPTPAPTSSAKSARRKRAPVETPTKPKGRASAVRLSLGLSVERPSASNESVMRTPGGTIRKCGERGLKCGKDFCFTCC